MMNNNLQQRYIPTGESNSGGFGHVVICNDTHLERKVAIKTVKDLTERKRVQDEISALLMLRSKHVVQLYDIIRSDDGKIFIVEEYIDGPDLFEYKEHIKTTGDLTAILWQISSGIADIHRFGVVHRDIKPNNIKIDGEGIVKIFDFGLSRTVENSATVGFVGTPAFAAPELLFDKRVVNFTNAVDVFAFGVTALCLSGIEELPAELRTINKRLTANPFNSSPFKMSNKMKSILFKCLSYNPNERPTMQEFSSYLKKKILQGTHKANVVFNGKGNFLDLNTPDVSLSFGNIGSLKIHYNEFDFILDNVIGEVSVNNRTASTGDILPGSCVIIIGGAHRHNSQRVFITFDISHPEVVL